MKLLSEHLTIDHTHHLKRNVYFMLWLHTDLQGDSTSPSLNEISPEYSFVGLMLKGHLMQRAHSLAKTLMLGKIEGWKNVRQRMRCSDGITDTMDIGLIRFRELMMDRGLVCCKPWGRKVGHD